MKRKGYIIIGLCLLAAAITAAAVWYFVSREEEPQEGQEGQEGMIINEHPTDGPGYYEDDMPHADPLIVGKWQSTNKKGWYKVYYDDYDEDTQKFWGKEWDEGEDVQEEDLNYHGNGWFRWEKKRHVLHEYSTMDAQDVPIHRKYEIQFVSTDSIAFCETDYNILYQFKKNE